MPHYRFSACRNDEAAITTETTAAEGSLAKLVSGCLGLAQRCLVGGEEGLEDFEVLLGLFIGRQMPALLEENDLRAGDGVRHAPCRERCDIHVVAAGDDQRREAKTRELGREIEILGGLLD